MFQRSAVCIFLQIRLLQVCLCMNGDPGQYKSAEEKWGADPHAGLALSVLLPPVSWQKMDPAEYYQKSMRISSVCDEVARRLHN